MRGQNILFCVLTFAKPERNNVLQPEPRSKALRDATHYYMRAWSNIKTREKNVISSLLYTYNKPNCLVLAFPKKRKKAEVCT